MASIQTTAKGYRAQVFVKGVRDSQVFRTRREAVSWAAARETEIRTQAKKPEADRHLMREAFEKYRDEVTPTKRGKRWEGIRLTSLCREPIADMIMGDVTSTTIAEWRDARLKQVQAGTVIREMTILRGVFEKARAEWEWIKHNPMDGVARPRAPDHREVLITWPQIRTMLKAMGYHRGPVRTVSHAVALCFLFALRTGMRAGEIAGLTWTRVRADHVILHETKTTPRHVPLPRQAARIIEHARGWDNVLVFGVTAPTLDALFRKYRMRAGLSGFTFHDSRHVAATMLAQEMNVLDLCRMFGWKNPKMAMTYYNPTASQIAQQLQANRDRLRRKQ